MTDLFVNGAAGLFVDRGAGAVRASEWRAADDDVRELAVALIALGGRHLDDAWPCADVRLEGGLRVHAVLPPVAPAGTVISIRVPRLDRPDLAALEAGGMFAGNQRAWLEAAVERRENLLITGAAGAGKTTLLAALLGCAAPTERIVTIEDVAELRIDHPHHVRLEARQPNLEGAGGIGLARLVREALRMRPDRLVVGECRGEEVRELLSALNTGHDGGAGTLHANGLHEVACAPRGPRRARGARRSRPRASGGQCPRSCAARRAWPGRRPQTRRSRAPRHRGRRAAPHRGRAVGERLIGRFQATGILRSLRRTTTTTTSVSGAAAETVLRLAVLLQAGIIPLRAWGHLADDGEPVARRVVVEVGHGTPLADAIAGGGPEWTDLAAAWAIATDVGAPLAVSLRALAGALRDAAEAADEVRIALAEPAGTARLLAWLPLVAVGLGVALGFDTLLTLATNPLGLGCLVAGAALIFTAHRWTGALVRRASAEPGIPGIGAELFAIALTGGVSMDRARAVVLTATGEPADAETEAVLDLSRRAGIPAAELLRASAALARHRARVEGRVRAAKLSSRLLLPLGVCTLPAFLLLGVAPMLLSVMSTMSLSL